MVEGNQSFKTSRDLIDVLDRATDVVDEVLAGADSAYGLDALLRLAMRLTGATFGAVQQTIDVPGTRAFCRTRTALGAAGTSARRRLLDSHRTGEPAACMTSDATGFADLLTLPFAGREGIGGTLVLADPPNGFIPADAERLAPLKALIAAMFTIEIRRRRRDSAEELVEIHRRLHRIVADLGVELLEADAELSGTVIDAALADLGLLIGADRTFVFEFDETAIATGPDTSLSSAPSDPATSTMSNTYEWCAPGVDPAKALLQQLPRSDFPWSLSILRHGPIVVPDVSQLPEEAAAERESLEMQGITAVVLIPLRDAGQLIGFVGADRVGGSLGWDEIERSALEQLGTMLAACIARMRSRQALRRVEAQLRRFAERLDVGLAIWDTTPTRGRFMNPAFERLTGIAPESWQSVPHAVLELIHPDDVSDVRAAVIRFHEGTVDPASRITDRIIRIQRDDEPRWIRLRVFPLDDDPAPRQLAALADDVTDTRRMQDEFTTALERARTADRAKTAFLSHINHELRTPLQAIMGFIGMLRIDPESDDRDELLELADRSVGELVQMIEELLQATRIEQGHFDVRFVDVDLRDLVGHVMSMSRTHFTQYGVTGSVDGPDLPVIVRTDERRLGQILLNLVNNAAKYNRPGGSVRTVMRTETSTAGIDEAVVEVIDTGHGLTPEQIERIFVPFERFEAEHGSVPGTGIGLPVAKTLARALGVQIEIDSSPDVGSTFRLRIPMRQLRDGDLGTYRVLLVARERDAVTDLALAVSGVELATEQSFDAAFSAAVLDHPDLVIVAGSLVERYGGAAISRFAALSSAEERVEVIAVGVDGSSTARDTAARAGASATFGGPIDVGAVTQFVLDRARRPS